MLIGDRLRASACRFPGKAVTTALASAILKLEDSMSTYLAKQSFTPAARRSPSSDEGGLLRRWFLAVARHWQRRMMITKLQSLDDRTLADIGLHRGDIARMVAEFSPQELGMTPVAQPTRAKDVKYDSCLKAA